MRTLTVEIKGVAGSGKTMLAHAIRQMLEVNGVACDMLDDPDPHDCPELVNKRGSFLQSMYMSGDRVQIRTIQTPCEAGVEPAGGELSRSTAWAAWHRELGRRSYRTPEAEVHLMEDTPDGLPSWQECKDNCDAGKGTALQQFIYDEEPAGINTGKSFRERLHAVIVETMKAAIDGASIDRLEGVSDLPSACLDLLKDIIAELRRAVGKFPAWPTDASHAVNVVAEEMGELQKEVNQMIYESRKSTRETVRKEALYLAAMSLRFLLSLDRYTYTPCPQHSQNEPHRVSCALCDRGGGAGVAPPPVCSPVVVIDGARYVPENQEQVPDRASFWYMHDNHTFSRLSGKLDEILAAAREWAEKSPYGMLCPVTLLRGEKEIRRLKKCVHARKELGDTSEWEMEVRGDADVMRLLSENAEVCQSRGRKKL